MTIVASRTTPFFLRMKFGNFVSLIPPLHLFKLQLMCRINRLVSVRHLGLKTVSKLIRINFVPSALKMIRFDSEVDTRSRSPGYGSKDEYFSIR